MLFHGNEGGKDFISEFAFLYQSALLLYLSGFFFFIFAAFHFGARECRVDEFLADTIPRSFFFFPSFSFHILLRPRGVSRLYACNDVFFFVSFHFSRKFWRAKAFIGSRAFFFLLFFLSLFSFSLFSYIYFGKWVLAVGIQTYGQTCR